MAMNLKRSGTALAVGAGSGALDVKTTPFQVAGQTVTYGAALEIVSVLGGGFLQWSQPFTAPEIVDGAVDAGIALLARRVTKNALAHTPLVGPSSLAAYRVNGQLAASPCARPMMGNVSGQPDYRLG